MGTKTRLTVTLPSDTESETETEDEMSEEEDINSLWEAAEDRVADTVEDLKEELSTIHPGIGDKITLARFDKFIQLTSSCL